MTAHALRTYDRNLSVQTRLGTIACVDCGAGPVVVLWPSMLMDADMMCAQIEALSQQYRVLAIDPPGQGKSGTVSASFTLDDSGDIAIAVLDAAGVEAAMFAGNSWGGMVAINVAARYPERCLAITIMNSSSAPAPLVHKIEFGAMPTVVGLLGITKLLIMIATRSFLGKTAHRNRPDLRAFIASKMAALDRTSVVNIVRSILLGRADQFPLLAKIKVAALIIGGTEDRIFPPSHQSVLHKGIAGSRLLMVDAGHFAPLEAAEEVSAALVAFIAENVSQ